MLVKGHKQQLTTILFNKIQFPAVTFWPSSVLALAGVGKTDGVVIDIGASGCHINFVLKGEVQGTANSSFGGNKLVSAAMKQQNIANEKDAEKWVIAHAVVQPKGAQLTEGGKIGELLFSEGKISQKLADFMKAFHLGANSFYILAGGVSKTKGLKERLIAELSDAGTKGVAFSEPEKDSTMPVALVGAAVVISEGFSFAEPGNLQFLEQRVTKVQHL